MRKGDQTQPRCKYVAVRCPHSGNHMVCLQYGNVYINVGYGGSWRTGENIDGAFKWLLSELNCMLAVILDSKDAEKKYAQGRLAEATQS